MEKVLTSLAQLVIDGPPSTDPDLKELRRMLAEESYMYRAPLRRDIVDVLRSSGGAPGARMADAWRPIYTAASPY